MVRTLVGEDGVAAHLDDALLSAAVALDGQGESIASARHAAAGFLARMRAEHGVAVSRRAVEVTQLVVSELVTNAQKYAAGPIVMDLRITGDLIEVQVWDSDPVLPVARAADVGRVGQHGLEIVMALCQSFEVTREPVGKRVTARLALTDEPSG
ncbi:ATP-binding protein [Streptomyces sp. WELS2]|uniref:ATP-binding protein n=1 Tax=Streptomyces sp. WELS2 TaxID=2749435 RepID=UPI0015EFE97F|nr:ATP-binding protein [Streptomyces sp. WELS2]